jgi:hypothetical protein
MIAFEVYINGKKISTAGVGNPGVLSTCLAYRAVGSYLSGEPPVSEYLRLDIGGYVSDSKEHLRWADRKLKPGDTVTVKIVRTESVDKPRERERTNTAADLRRRKQYVRRMAKELGWKLKT